MNRRGELDAIVVGGGAIGAALALALARDEFDVALVEARAPKPWRADDDPDLNDDLKQVVSLQIAVFFADIAVIAPDLAALHVERGNQPLN